jgi:SAM-dependent methyltransferase
MILANFLKGNEINLLDPLICLSDIEVKEIKIFDTSYKSPIYKGIKNKSIIYMSEYLSKKSRKIMQNFYSCDLQSLPFDNETFDYVISSEVFEHVMDPLKGFTEVNRVLKKGGYHIFTIPFNPNSKTIKRVVSQNGKIQYILPKAYHRDPLSISGSLVVTEFGYDLIDRLKEIGFDTNLFLPPVNLNFGRATAFVSRKVL